MTRTHRRTRAAASATVTALAVAVITAATSPAQAAAPPTRASVGPLTSSVTLGADGSIHAPAVLPAGRAHVRVTGADGEALQLVAPRHDASVAALVADYQQFAATGLPGGTERDFRFAGGAFTGADAYLDLAPGTYYAFDASPSRLTAAHVATIQVRGPSRDCAGLPNTTGSVTAIGHDTWADHPAAIGPSGYLLFTNASAHTHLVNLLQLLPGTTLAQVDVAVASPDADVSALSTGHYLELGVLSPGGRELVSYTLAAGTYAVLDLWPDDTTGRSHSALGMVRLIHVT